MTTTTPETVIPFEGAEKHLALNERWRLRLLEKKIPPEMRGLFGLIVSGEPGLLMGIELLPNAATRVMNAFLTAEDQPENEAAKHDTRQTQRYVGAEFDEILMDTNNGLFAAANTRELTPYPRTKEAELREELSAQGLEYRYTTTLSQLLHHRDALSHTEALVLEKLAAPIPHNLRGFFCCDVAARADGEHVITHMGVDPNLVSNRIALELLTPILAPESKYMQQASIRAGIRMHYRPFMLATEEVLAAAEHMPAAQMRS